MSVHRLLQDLYLDGAPYVVNDPGDAGTLYVDRQMAVVKITTVAAETRTLPDPKFDGQIMMLIMETDGGDATITASTAFDVAGNTSITLDDAGDYLLFVAIDTDGDGTMAWRLIVRTGTASSAQADQGVMTTVGSNTGTAGAGLSLIGDTSSANQAAALMNDLVALEEDILALDAIVTALRTAMITHGLIKGAA